MRLLLLIILFVSVLKNTHAEDIQAPCCLPIVLIAAASSLSLLVMGALSYQEKTETALKGKKLKVPDDIQYKAAKLALYQYENLCKSEGVAVDESLLPGKRFVLNHSDLVTSPDSYFYQALYDEETSLVARLFLEDKKVIVSFKGCESTLERLGQFTASFYKATEWINAIYNHFGRQYYYELVGFSGSSGAAMVAGFQLFELLAESSHVSVIGFNPIYPENYYFQFINGNEKHLERYLKCCVTAFQNVDNVRFRKLGIDIPFLGGWSWYGRINHPTYAMIRSYMCMLPKCSKKKIKRSEGERRSAPRLGDDLDSHTISHWANYLNHNNKTDLYTYLGF